MRYEVKSFGERNNELAYSRRVGAYAVILNQNGEYLVVQSSDGDLFLIGGGIEQGEDSIDALRREAVEEIGFSLNVGEFIGKAEKHWVSPQYSALSQHNIGYFYVCTLADRITVPLEKEPMRWVSLEVVEEKLFHEHHLYMLKKTLY